MFELIYPATSLLSTALLSWSAFRAWRAKNPLLKWGGAPLAALLSTLTALVSVMLVAGLLKFHARSAPTLVMKVERTPEEVRRGQAITDGFCSACHSKTGTLTGGVDIGKHFPLPVGAFVSSNLTLAGQLAGWTDGDIFRAIRNSVDRDGHWLFVMSITNASRLSDADIRSVIAYLRSLPAAGEATPNPPDRISALGLLMLGAGMLPTGKPVSNAVTNSDPDTWITSERVVSREAMALRVPACLTPASFTAARKRSASVAISILKSVLSLSSRRKSAAE